MLSDSDIVDLWTPGSMRPVMGKNKVLDFARAIEDEVRKRDDALIRQMLDALKNCRATGALDDQAYRLASSAITASRARLGEKA